MTLIGPANYPWLDELKEFQEKFFKAQAKYLNYKSQMDFHERIFQGLLESMNEAEVEYNSARQVFVDKCMTEYYGK